MSNLNPVAVSEVVQQLTDERKRLSKVILLVESYQIDGLMKVAEQLQFGFMWLGKAKGAIGVANPYPESTNPDNVKIEPAQDVAISAEFYVIDDINDVKILKALRADVDAIAAAVWNDSLTFPQHHLYQVCIRNAWTYLSNGKMVLGLLLGARRDEEPQPVNTKPQDIDPSADVENDNIPEGGTLSHLPPPVGLDAEGNPGTPPADPEAPTEEPPSGEELIEIQQKALQEADDASRTKPEITKPTTDESSTETRHDSEDEVKSNRSRSRKNKASDPAAG